MPKEKIKMQAIKMFHILALCFAIVTLQAMINSVRFHAGNYQIQELPRTCKVEVDFIGTATNFSRRDFRVQFQFDDDDNIASLGLNDWRSLDCNPRIQGFYIQFFHETSDFIEPNLRGKPIGPIRHYSFPESGGREEIIEIEGRIARIFVSVHFVDVEKWVEDQNRMLTWILNNGPAINARSTELTYDSITIVEGNINIPGFRYTCVERENPTACCLCRNPYTSDDTIKNEELLQFAMTNPNNEDSTCPICFNVMKGEHYPIKVLTCGHNVCVKCHEEMSSRKKYTMSQLENI